MIGLLWSYRLYLVRWVQALFVILLAAVVVVLLVDSAAFMRVSGRFALLVTGAVFAPVWFGRRVPDAERAAWLWLGIPLLGILFLVSKAGTHVYVFFIPWAIVSGMVVGWLWGAVNRQWGSRAAHWLVAPLMVFLVLLFANYVRWMFVVNEVEVLRTWDENRPRGYWTSYATPDVESIFGFPNSERLEDRSRTL